MWTVVGHQRVVDLLRQSLKQERLAHAYVVVGPRQVGKMTLAINLAQALNCTGEDKPCQACTSCQRIARGNHSDVPVLQVASGGETSRGAARKEIGIDQIREMQRLVGLQPLEGVWRVFIINGADQLSHEAANRLLKTLEEPPSHVLLVLLAVEERFLLPTILSRCQRLDLACLPFRQIEDALVEAHGITAEKARLLAHLSGGAIGWALAACRDGELVEHRARRLQQLESLAEASLEERFSVAGRLASTFARDRDEVREGLSLWQSWWRDLLLVNQDAGETVVHLDCLEKLQTEAQRYHPRQIVAFVRSLGRTWRELELNVNPRLALEVLMLELPLPSESATVSNPSR